MTREYSAGRVASVPALPIRDAQSSSHDARPAPTRSKQRCGRARRTRSFLYKKYELLVAFLLERRHLAVGELVAGRLDEQEVERQLQAEPGL